MRKVSQEQFKNDILSFFIEKSGMTIEQAKNKIKQQLVIDRYGNTDNDRIKINNVTLFYTNNDNYCGGVKNGYGKGFYLSNAGFTGGSIIKV